MTPRLFRPDEGGDARARRSDLTVADVIALYLRHSLVNNVHCPEALKERERTLGLFSRKYGPCPWWEMRPYHLTEWVDGHEGWKSAATRRTAANQVKACFNWACEQRRVKFNPFRSVRYQEGERRPDMPDESLRVILNLATKAFERAGWFLRFTGCRVGELCKAEWADVDLEKGVWTIHKHKTRKRTKKSKKVALTPEAVALLRSIPMKPGLIFLNSRGRPWTSRNIGRYLKGLKEKHGLDESATLHGIRHRFGSAAVAAGAPLKLVAQQLGHSTVTTTERYYCDIGGEIDAIRGAANLATPKD